MTDINITCRYCDHEPFETWRDLALHISTSKRGHRGGKKWAAKYLAMNSLSPEKRSGRDFNHTPLTTEDRENQLNTLRPLSGKTDFVNAYCPKCNRRHRPLLPREFTESPDAIRQRGLIVKVCQGCGGEA